MNNLSTSSRQVKKIFITTTVFLALIVPSVSLIYADAGSAPTAGGSGTQPPVLLTNPLSSQYSSISGIVGALLNVVEYIGAIACALWIIWGGFLFVKARGNPEALSEAKKTLWHAVIGTAIILGAGAILAVIQNTITAIKS
jgi:hypothetical protein